MGLFSITLTITLFFSRSIDEDLREACALGDEGKVMDLVRKGADVNSSNKVNGWTALHWAAYRGHKLVKNCISIN